LSTTSVTILGSTGSIGRSALEVIGYFPERFQVKSLAAHSNIDLLARQVRQFHPESVAVVDSAACAELHSMGLPVEILEGAAGVEELACGEVDVTLCAIVGATGLKPMLNAIEHTGRVAVANKEPLVMGGSLVIRKARTLGVPLIPVDSEHNAVFQCLEGHRVSDVYRIHLTASGGPFYRSPRETLNRVTPEEAANHPTWDMGTKISVDSATLMNKGLEIIEAMWLFDLPVDQIDVVIHPQSVVHSMVEFMDGSILAHLGLTDMRFPILFALAWPERVESPIGRLDLTSLQGLTFAAPDFAQFPCLGYAVEAARTGGTATAVLNAANEAAVEAFCRRRISFLQISDVVRDVMDTCPARTEVTLESVLAADQVARRQAEQVIIALEHKSHVV
jgi:1-deoxy-D-xylulose-5-phosphate reductoisomerase